MSALDLACMDPLANAHTYFQPKKSLSNKRVIHHLGHFALCRVALSSNGWLTRKIKWALCWPKWGGEMTSSSLHSLKQQKEFNFFFLICIKYKIVSFLNASFFYCSSVRLLNRYLYLFNYNLSRFKGDLKVRRINILQILNDKHEKMMAL